MIKSCKILIVLLCGLFFVSCLNSSTRGTESTSRTEADSSVQEKLDKVYAIVTKEESNTYMSKMEEGFKQACEEIGVESRCLGPTDYSPKSQIEIIDTLIEDGVDVIAVSANDASALEEVLQKAIAQNITVVSLDSAVQPSSRMLHIQQADPEIVGRVLFQAAAQMINYQGTVGVISTTEYVTNQNLWIKWLKNEALDNQEKYQDIVLLPEVFGEDDYDISVEKTQYLITEYPELDIIITPSAVSMSAVGNTLFEQGSDVLFTGLGLPSEMAQFIEDSNNCKWFYLWNPIELGYLAAYSGNALNGGTITGSADDVFSAGSLGEKRVTKSSDGGTEVILGDPVKFDEKNIDMWKIVY